MVIINIFCVFHSDQMYEIKLYWDSRVCQIYIQVHKARKCSNPYWEMNLLVFSTVKFCHLPLSYCCVGSCRSVFWDKQPKKFYFFLISQYLISEDLYMLSLHFLYLPHFFQQTRREKLHVPCRLYQQKMTRQRCTQLKNWVRTTVGFLQLQ